MFFPDAIFVPNLIKSAKQVRLGSVGKKSVQNIPFILNVTHPQILKPSKKSPQHFIL